MPELSQRSVVLTASPQRSAPGVQITGTTTIANANTSYGQNLYVVGNQSALGNWTPASGFALAIQGSGAKRSQAKGLLGMTNDWNNLGAPKKSKKQSGSGGNSRKVHDTKGKNTHGRRSW